MRHLIVSVAVLALCACSADETLYLGYVEGEFVRVAAPDGGRLLALDVERGQTVTPGQSLFTLERSREQAALDGATHRLERAKAEYSDQSKGKRPEEMDVIEAQRAQALADLALAEHNFERNSELFERGMIAKAVLDATVAERNRASAQLRESEANLRTARLAARSDVLLAAEEEIKAAAAEVAQARWHYEEKSPVAAQAGLVADTYFRPGEWVAAGQAVVSLLPPENRILRFYVPEARVSGIHPGDAVQVFCDGCGDAISAVVNFIAPEAEFTPPVIYSRHQRTHLMFRVEARPSAVDAPSLAPGLPIEVRPADG